MLRCSVSERLVRRFLVMIGSGWPSCHAGSGWRGGGPYRGAARRQKSEFVAEAVSTAHRSPVRGNGSADPDRRPRWGERWLSPCSNPNPDSQLLARSRSFKIDPRPAQRRRERCFGWDEKPAPDNARDPGPALSKSHSQRFHAPTNAPSCRALGIGSPHGAPALSVQLRVSPGPFICPQGSAEHGAKSVVFRGRRMPRVLNEAGWREGFDSRTRHRGGGGRTRSCDCAGPTSRV